MYGYGQSNYRRAGPGHNAPANGSAAQGGPNSGSVSVGFPGSSAPQGFAAPQPGGPYGPQVQAPGYSGWRSSGAEPPAKSVLPSRATRKISHAVSRLPWRPITLVLVVLSMYFLYQYQKCRSERDSATTQIRPESPKAYDFADLKKTLGAPQVGGSTSGDTRSILRDELRQHAVEPSSVDVAALAADEQLGKRIIVSEKAHVMYCPIPKAANSNWKLLIRKYEGFEDYKLLEIAHDRTRSGLKYLKDYSPDEIKRLLNDPQMLKFAFVRDPYARTLSCYLNKFVNKEKESAEYATYMAHLYTWDWVRANNIKERDRPTFADFVDVISKQPWEQMNEHWAPQTYLCGLNRFPYDFIGKLEEVQEYAPKLIQWMGGEGSFPTQNEINFPSGGTQNVVEEYYDSSIKDAVRKTFDGDFNSLKYPS